MKYRRRRKKRVRKGLAGFADAIAAPKVLEQKHIAIGVLAAVGGNILGAGLGKYSFWGGAIVSGIGVATRNFYLAAAGAGMLVNTINKTPGATNGPDDDGLSVDGFRDRVLHLMDNYKSRIMLESGAEMSGLGENVQYFHNPYELNKSSVDLSALDRVQEQVANMNATNGLSDVDPDDRNF